MRCRALTKRNSSDQPSIHRHPTPSRRDRRFIEDSSKIHRRRFIEEDSSKKKKKKKSSIHQNPKTCLGVIHSFLSKQASSHHHIHPYQPANRPSTISAPTSSSTSAHAHCQRHRRHPTSGTWPKPRDRLPDQRKCQVSDSSTLRAPTDGGEGG
ncbi:hypothetical protein EJ03DRAFT_53810 [Teratosphaeria nubilosa]|uniref:Uncharacterized protein n=1 Tax=Teratosphaeria nubilosa TaxID=161662 RepID=A0A6G1KT06_9PEZI|nr:hypothetical protein EJ03DRAFT_53810 [Teratosphaeria nubilosa]